MSAVQQLLLGGRSEPGTGQVEYTIPGTYFWMCPAGVTSISVVCIGGGARGGEGTDISGANGGGGGGRAYYNVFVVVPGNTYEVLVGAGGTAETPRGGDSSFNVSTCIAYGGDGSGGGGGISLYPEWVSQGGNGGSNPLADYGGSGGGGAAGYSPGGNGAGATSAATPGQLGGGGGGGSGLNNTDCGGANGGGAGLVGDAPDGAAGTSSDTAPTAGGNGSNGNFGYGGGGSGHATTGEPAKDGGSGAVRIIWPGNTRYFPNTRTADE